MAMQNEQGDTELYITANAKQKISDTTQRLIDVSESTDLMLIENLNPNLAGSQAEAMIDADKSNKMKLTAAGGAGNDQQPQVNGKPEVRTVQGVDRTIEAHVYIDPSKFIKSQPARDWPGATVPMPAEAFYFHEIAGHEFRTGETDARIWENKWREIQPSHWGRRHLTKSR